MTMRRADLMQGFRGGVTKVGTVDLNVQGNQGGRGVQITVEPWSLGFGETKEVRVRVCLRHDGQVEAEVVDQLTVVEEGGS